VHVLGRHRAVNPFAFHEDVDVAFGKYGFVVFGLASRESFDGVGMRRHREELESGVEHGLAGGGSGEGWGDERN